MAWQAFLVGLGKRQNDEGAQVFTVVYTDGRSKLQRDYSRPSFSLVSLQAVARDEVRRLEAEPPTVDLAGVAVGMAIDLTPPAPVLEEPPTKDDAERSAFLAAWQTTQKQQRAIEAGLLTPDDKAVVETASALQAAFRPEYLELL